MKNLLVLFFIHSFSVWESCHWNPINYLTRTNFFGKNHQFREMNEWKWFRTKLSNVNSMQPFYCCSRCVVKENGDIKTIWFSFRCKCTDDKKSTNQRKLIVAKKKPTVWTNWITNINEGSIACSIYIFIILFQIRNPTHSLNQFWFLFY